MNKPHHARILIAVGINNFGIVLATDSEWVAEDVATIGNNIADIGIGRDGYDGPAFILWEGDISSEGGETEYDGECYSVHGLELRQWMDMQPPEMLPINESGSIDKTLS